MHGFRRKSGDAHGDVFRAVRPGCAVLDPFTALRNDGLAGLDVENTGPGLYAKKSAQHDRVLIELRRLAGSDPPARAFHTRDAYSGGI